MVAVTRAEAHRGAYENPRPDVQRHVPPGVRRMLDIGCSSGAFGAAIKARDGAAVVGIEFDPVRARGARERLDEVVEGDVEALLSDPAAADLGSFDCIVAADVLEHLRDPWRVLRQAVELLEPRGTVVVSLPNIRYWDTFRQLGLRGTWPRHDEGIFDRTHLRWFTLWDGIELFREAGLEVTEWSPNYRLKPSNWETERQGRWFARTPLRSFFTYQYVFVGRRAGSAAR